MKRLGLKYINLTTTPVDLLEERIRILKPHVLLGNVESLTSPEIQRKISRLQISYIAVDEAQVQPGLILKVCNILLIGGRPIGRVGLSAIFASALALAACHLPGSPIHAQLGYAEHREPREDQG